MVLGGVLLPVRFVALASLSLATVTAAEVPAQIKPDHVVGQVLGKKITAGEIKLTEPIDVTKKFDARDTADWEQMGRILAAFGKPISDRFTKDEKIEVTEEEVQKYKEGSKFRAVRHLRSEIARRDEVDRKLEKEGISPADKEKLEKERDLIDRMLPGLLERKNKEVTDAQAKYMILPWKVERALHKRYGGRVIFQQFGPEALDARRQLFEEAEKRGDLKFTDSGVRHLFYYYYGNMDHVVTDEKVLEKPWWEQRE